MSDAQPYEVLAIEDKEQFPTRHGTTLQAMQWSVKAKDGTILSVGINRRPANQPPNIGETVWLETWENENGFLKAKKMQGPRGQAKPSDGGIDHQAHPVLLRRHAQDMALRYAGIKGETDLQRIEEWTQHFEEQAQRASGAVQGNGSPITAGARDSAPAPPQASNGGERKISEKQITGFILRLQQQRGISDENMALLVKSFGVDRLKDLPMSQVDRFAKAMADPIPDGTSDVPAPPEPVAAPVDDDEDDIPFAFPPVPTFTEAKAHRNRR